MAYIILIRRGSSVKWNTTQYIPMAGEPTLAVDTNVFKIGDGATEWENLPAYPNEEQMIAAIQDALGDIIIGDYVTHEDFEDHVDSEDPHLNYDDGGSLVLLYENAKV